MAWLSVSVSMVTCMFGCNASNPLTIELSVLVASVPMVGKYEARVIDTWVLAGTLGKAAPALPLGKAAPALPTGAASRCLPDWPVPGRRRRL